MSDPTIPRCEVRGHDHELAILHTLTQQGTGKIAYMLECPSGRWRFLYIPEVWEQIRQMPRYQRPRFGWKDQRGSNRS